jgi:outer membrane protein
LQSDLDRREKELRSQADKLKRLEQKLQKDGAGMSSSERKKLERDILSRQRKLKNARDEARDELALRQSEERNKLMRKVAEVVKAIGKEGGFDLILTDGVAYASEKVDISGEVLSRLKKAGR